MWGVVSACVIVAAKSMLKGYNHVWQHIITANPLLCLKETIRVLMLEIQYSFVEFIH